MEETHQDVDVFAFVRLCPRTESYDIMDIGGAL